MINHVRLASIARLHHAVTNGASYNRRATAEWFIEPDADIIVTKMENPSEADTLMYEVTMEDTDATVTLDEYSGYFLLDGGFRSVF